RDEPRERRGVVRARRLQPRDDARPILGRAVLAQLELALDLRDPDLDADDAGEPLRVVARHPGCGAAALEARREPLDVATRRRRIVDRARAAVDVHGRVVPGRHTGLRVPGRRHVAVRPNEHHEHVGARGEVLPLRIRARGRPAAPPRGPLLTAADPFAIICALSIPPARAARLRKRHRDRGGAEGRTMRRVAVFAVAAVALALLGLPPVLGMLTESQVTARVAALDESGVLKASLRSYERGWVRSDARIAVRVAPRRMPTLAALGASGGMPGFAVYVDLKLAVAMDGA